LHLSAAQVRSKWGHLRVLTPSLSELDQYDVEVELTVWPKRQEFPAMNFVLGELAVKRIFSQIASFT
jgi:hypothetical protein